MTDLSQLRQLGLFDARVPRYTSYPTAPQFSGGVGPADFAGWLRQVAPGEAISLYLHVPFCRRLCWFCACRTQGTATGGPVAAYVEDLVHELQMVRALLPADVHLSRLHWGGGTPTLLEPGQIALLAAAVARALPFAAEAEFSVEIDPNEIDPARADALAAAGLTRASVGVQDFHPEIQRAIGRDQSYEVTEAAVSMMRDRGIASLNMDLLYGLPFQTAGRIRAGVAQVIALRPDRVALYGYAHVPWMARRQAMIPTAALPEPEERLELAAEAERLFLAAGYLRIGIDHFALPGDGLAIAAAGGRLRRNFQGYTDDTAQTLVGLGASSISRFRQGYAQNAAATGAWTAAVRAGRLATARGHAFGGEDVLRGRLIEALMCDFGADLAAVAAACGASPEAVRALVAPLPDAFPGLVRLEGGRLQILPEGRVLTRMVAQRLDAYATRPAGYSQAV